MLFDTLLKQIIKYYNQESIEIFIDKLNNSILKRDEVSIPYLTELIGVKEVVRLTTLFRDVLSVNVQNRYGSIKVKDSLASQFQENIKEYLVERYSMNSKVDHRDNLVKRGIEISESILKRPGITWASNQSFKLDKNMLIKYRKDIINHAIKGMEGVEDTSYMYIEDVFDQLLKDKVFTMGGNISDQRGRCIYRNTSKIFNPITCKPIRACIKLKNHKPLNADGKKAVYLFIAEEVYGSSAFIDKTVNQKILAGMRAYNERILPDDLTTKIWLERIYNGLDNPSKWDIVIELDATMSMGQIVGAITRDKELLTATNVIGKKLTDPWTLDGVPRKAVKSVGTPRFYGSKASSGKLIGDEFNEYQQDVVKYLGSKKFKSLRLLKTLLIDKSRINVPKYKVQGHGEEYVVEVQHKKCAGAKLEAFKVFTNNKVKTFLNHKVVWIKDYKYHKLFNFTCLVHNLDSKVADNVVMKFKSLDEFMLPIFDAFLIHPNNATKLREVYSQELLDLAENGEEILNNFAKSIGVLPKMVKQVTNSIDKIAVEDMAKSMLLPLK